MRKFFIGLFVLALLAAGVAFEGMRRMQLYLEQPLNLAAQGQIYHLEPGTSFYAMTQELARRGILGHPELLQFWVRINPKLAQIKAGEYRLDAGLDTNGLLEMLSSGDVITRQVTLVEGTTWKQAVKVLKAESQLKQTLDDSPIFEQIGVQGPLAEHPEGQFFPDTYSYTLGDSDVDILRRAYQRLNTVLMEAWRARATGLPYETPYEALIMASIIEKETGVPEERGEIAGVFVRRLNKGMKLQTDPTIIYGLGEDYDGNLRKRHLLDASNPYNTYRHKGLPPSPIGLVGKAAIHAALNPAEGDTLYFVARGDGSHYFSATLKEHEAAVRQYQIERRRKDYRSAPPSSSSTSVAP